MTPTETEQLKHLLSLLNAKLEGKQLEKHFREDPCAIARWEKSDEYPTIKTQQFWRIAPDPAPQKPEQKPGYKQSVEAYNKGDWEPAEPKVCEHCRQEIKSGFRHEPNLKVLGFRQCFVEPLTIPQPTFRPYRDASEFPLEAWLQHKDWNPNRRIKVLEVNCMGAVIKSSSGPDMLLMWPILRRDWKVTLNGSDWGPAGVQEE